MQFEYFTTDDDDLLSICSSADFEEFSYQTLAKSGSGETSIISSQLKLSPRLTQTTASSSSAAASSFSSSSFCQHIILPSDTLQGICLQYKISAIKLRQVNRFSGSSLLLAPKRLIIPKKKGVIVKEQNKESKEFKIHFIKAEYERLNTKEIKAYLEMTDWSVEKALAVIGDDLLWERENNKENGNNVGPILTGGIRENCMRIERVKRQLMQLHLRSMDHDDDSQEEQEPLLVVGLPLDISAMKENMHKAIHNDVHVQVHSEFGIELKDLSNNNDAMPPLHIPIPTK